MFEISNNSITDTIKIAINVLKENEFLEFPRYGNSCVSFTINNEAYVGLGKQESGYVEDENGDFHRSYIDTTYSDFYKYSPVTDTWTEIAPYPGGHRYYPLVFTDGKRAYLGLGSDNYSSSSSYYYDDIYYYEPWTDSWKIMPDAVFSARRYTKAFQLNGSIYAGGGSYKENESVTYLDFWKLDTTTLTWIRMNDLPEDMAGWRTSAYINDSLYCIPTNGNIYTYDEAEDEFSLSISINTWKNNESAFVVGDKCIINGTQSTIALVDFEKRDILFFDDTKSWKNVMFQLGDTLYQGLGYYRESGVGDIYSKGIHRYLAPPLGMELVDNKVFHNDTIGAFVGDLTVDFIEPFALHTFKMVSSTVGKDTLDNANYYIEADKLYLNSTLDINNSIDSILVSASNENDRLIERLLLIYIEEGSPSKIISSKDDVFKIYPNPTHGVLYLDKLDASVSINELQVFDSYGRSVKLISDAHNNIIDISGFNPGIYFIVIKTDSDFYVEKVILD